MLKDSGATNNLNYKDRRHTMRQPRLIKH